MTELIGNIIGGLGIIAGIILVCFGKVDSTLLDARRTIKEEFRLAYHEFANCVSQDAINIESRNACVRRLKDLHYASHGDLARLRRIDWLMTKLVKLMVCMWIIVVTSLLIGYLVFDEKQSDYRVIFLIGVPGILLAAEFYYVVWATFSQKYLKKIVDAYEHLEYPS